MKGMFLIPVFLLIFILGQSQTKNFLDQPYIEVTGSADSLITPNEIFIKIIISERDTKDRISIQELEGKMISTLKELGIDIEKDLTTNDMSSNFKYYLLKSKDILKSKQYILKVIDATTASKVFVQLEEIGISNTSIDRIDHSELEVLKNTMRTKAVQNAKTRAVALTQPLNQIVGPAVHIIDIENYNNVNMSQGQLSEVVVVGYSVARKNKEAELPKIEFKKILVATNVNVKFVLK